MNNSLFEILMYLKGYNISKFYSKINQLKKKSFIEYHDWLFKKKWEIVNYHYNNNNTQNFQLIPNILTITNLVWNYCQKLGFGINFVEIYY